MPRRPTRLHTPGFALDGGPMMSRARRLSIRAEPSPAAAKGARPRSAARLAGNEPLQQWPTSSNGTGSLAVTLAAAAGSLAEGAGPVAAVSCRRRPTCHGATSSISMPHDIPGGHSLAGREETLFAAPGRLGRAGVGSRGMDRRQVSEGSSSERPQRVDKRGSIEHRYAMRTALNIDDQLLSEALRLSGRWEKTAVVRAGLEAMIALEAARRPARLGVTEPGLRPIRPRRSRRAS